jgi:hypothetical protein
VYVCSVCKKAEWFNWVPNFDTTRLRKCPNCGTLDDTTDKEYLLTRKAELTEQLNKLNDDLMTIVSRLEVLEIEQRPMPEQEGVMNAKDICNDGYPPGAHESQ